MASPANQEPSHGLAMQRQQQELIQILAQHFHHQFYQLASTNNGTNSNNGTANISHQIRPPLSAVYQPQTQYANEAAVLGGHGGFEMQSMNLSAAAASSGKNQLFHNHLFRSHSTNSNTGSSSLASQFNTTTESLTGIDFTTQSSNSNPSYAALNDMNIFNALGLNLTNNQLVLSLQQQQQSLLQAAAAARQYDLRYEFEERTSSVRNGRSNSGETNSNLSSNELQDHHKDGKAMLKFSINTILGRGSPRSGVDQAIKPMNQVPPADEQASKLFKKKSFERDNQLGATSSMVDCDPSESGSDSSSLNSSLTPTPQATSSTSILFNHQTSPHDHHNYHNRANMSAGNHSDSLAHGQQALRHHPHQNHHSLPFLASSAAFPWTVAARGKPRRGMMRRAVFSDSQRVGLEKRFQLQKYISKPDRKKLAEKLGLRDSQVKIWFQNRRMKWRNSKERELLSAGGSREQTLPTRNNPNPDLSDVGETIKRLTATVTSAPTNSTEPQVNSLNK